MDPWKPPTTVTDHLAEALPLLLIVLAMTAWMFVPDRAEAPASAETELALEVDP